MTCEDATQLNFKFLQNKYKFVLLFVIIQIICIIRRLISVSNWYGEF